MYPVHLTGTRLHVRELVSADVDGVHAIYGDEASTRHLSFEPRTRAEVQGIVERGIAAAHTDPRTEYVLAVVEDQDLIGVVRLALDPHQPRAATFGLAVHTDRWRRGYGTEALRLLLTLAFDRLDLHRVWGARSPLNTASAALMTGCGMVEEGLIREHVQKGGVWRDSVVHAVLDREWAAIR